jgi:hypothetical protein
MLNILSKKSIIVISTIMTLVMFTVVMFIINPSIDGKNGIDVLSLQLAFNKEVAIEIINSWSKSGIENFNKFIFTDYIYALSYSIFFSSILSVLILKKSIQNILKYKLIIYLPFIAGLFDWIENTLELLFINNPIEFSNTLFFIHSIIASLKWISLPIIVTFIIKLSLQDNANANKT